MFSRYSGRIIPCVLIPHVDFWCIWGRRWASHPTTSPSWSQPHKFISCSYQDQCVLAEDWILYSQFLDQNSWIIWLFYLSLKFFHVVKYTWHKIYHFNHFYICSSVALSTFTLLWKSRCFFNFGFIFHFKSFKNKKYVLLSLVCYSVTFYTSGYFQRPIVVFYWVILEVGKADSGLVFVQMHLMYVKYSAPWHGLSGIWVLKRSIWDGWVNVPSSHLCFMRLVFWILGWKADAFNFIFAVWWTGSPKGIHRGWRSPQPWALTAAAVHHCTMIV